MADQTNVTTEKIKYVAEGLDKVLKGNRELQQALNALEGTSPTIGIDPAQLKEMQDLRQELDEVKKKLRNLKEESKETGGVWDKLFGKSDKSSGFLDKLSMFSWKFQQLWHMVVKVVDAMDSLASMFLESDKAALKLAASGGKVAQGWGWAKTGISQTGAQQVSAFAREIERASTALSDSFGGVEPDKIYDALSGFSKGGMTSDLLRGKGQEDIEKLFTIAADNSFILNGSLDDLAGTAETLGDWMMRFNLTASQSDKILKGVAIDAHAAGMGTERFLGSVRSISAEMGSYGSHVEQISGLLSKFGQSVGGLFAEQGLKGLLGGMRGVSAPARMFALQQVGASNVAGFLNEDLKHVSDSAKNLKDELNAANNWLKTVTAKGGDAVELEKAKNDISAKSIQLSQLELKERRLRSAKAIIEDASASPFAKSAAMKELGPVGMINLMKKVLGEKDFRDPLALMSSSVFPKLAAMLGGADQAEEMLKRLQELQGKDVSIDDTLKNMGSADKARQDTLNNLVQSEADRAKSMAQQYQSILQNIETVLKQLLEQVRDILREVQRYIHGRGGIMGAVDDSLQSNLLSVAGENKRDRQDRLIRDYGVVGGLTAFAGQNVAATAAQIAGYKPVSSAEETQRRYLTEWPPGMTKEMEAAFLNALRTEARDKLVPPSAVNMDSGGPR